MTMTSPEIKATLALRSITMSALAKQEGVSVQTVSMVVSGLRRSPRVEKAIAKLAGKPMHKVFPPSVDRRRTRAA